MDALVRFWPLFFVLTGLCAAQEPRFRTVEPRELGLDIPPGAVQPGKDQAVVTNDGSGRQVVGKRWACIGGHSIVLLPNGELVVRPNQDAPPTGQRFSPSKPEELMRDLSRTLPSFNTKKGRHYVYAYNTSEPFARAAQGTLESMVPGMMNHARQLRIPTHNPEFPLVAIMFRTRQQFDQYRRMPAGVVAYYDTLTNRIVMYEESPLYRQKPELAIQQTISTIAHEGAHQILHNIGVQQRLSVWPMWLSEGLAEYYSPTTFGKNLRWKGAGHVNDMRMFELELYLKGRSSDASDGQMIEHTVSAARLTSTGYAAAWSLTHFMAKTKREEFNAFIRRISELGPFETYGTAVAPGIVPDNVQMFREHFGMDLAETEGRLVKYLKSLPYSDPFKEWPHFVASVEVPQSGRPRRQAELFHSPDMAEKWAGEIVASLPDSQRRLARQAVEVFPNRLVAEQYARQFLSAGR